MLHFLAEKGFFVRGFDDVVYFEAFGKDFPITYWHAP